MLSLLGTIGFFLFVVGFVSYVIDKTVFFFMGNVLIYEIKIKIFVLRFVLGVWFFVGIVIEYIVIEFLCICR